MKGAGLIARALGGATVGIDPLHGGDVRERPASAAVHDVQFEPGNVVLRPARARLPTTLPLTGAAHPLCLPRLDRHNDGRLSYSSRSRVAIGSRNTQVSLPSLPSLHS